MERFPTAYPIDRIRWEQINIVLGGDMAWVSYDQIGTDTGDDFDLAGVHHELKIFHRVDGGWKIGCLVLLERAVEHAAHPLIEVAADGKILWMNRLAEVRMRDHPGLVVAPGPLRARRRDRDPALREALRWAFRQLHDYLPPSLAARPARAVPLGEDEAAAPLYCWILFEDFNDNKALISFDDAQQIARRPEEAAAVCGLSPARLRLARLILDGHDLAAASDALGVSVNTLRTHLQRMFDRTGARSQAALIRVLLSVEAPTT
jgi:DNA-binding CsgD family transcriptional regulator